MSKGKLDLSTHPNNPLFKGDGMNPTGKINLNRSIGSYQRNISNQHRAEFWERFEYDNLPFGLTKDLIERMLFYRGSAALFEFNGTYFVTPYMLNSMDSIDSYGRFNGIVPLAWTGVNEKGDFKDSPFIVGLDLKYPVIYDVEQPFTDKPAVLLFDRAPEFNMFVESEFSLSRQIIRDLSQIIVLTDMDLINTAKVMYVRVPDEQTKLAVEQQFANYDESILDGKRVIPVVGNLDFQELQKASGKMDASQFMQAYQSRDNLRKSYIGVDNGGAFLKQEHMTDQETSMNAVSGNYVLNHAFRQRKEAFELFNKVHGTNVVVRINDFSSGDIVAEEGSQTKHRRGEDNVGEG